MLFSYDIRNNLTVSCICNGYDDVDEYDNTDNNGIDIDNAEDGDHDDDDDDDDDDDNHVDNDDDNYYIMLMNMTMILLIMMIMKSMIILLTRMCTNTICLNVQIEKSLKK